MFSEELAHLPALDLHFPHFHALIGCFSRKEIELSLFFFFFFLKDIGGHTELMGDSGERARDSVIIHLKFGFSRGKPPALNE